jgi:hypothetical protein
VKHVAPLQHHAAYTLNLNRLQHCQLHQEIHVLLASKRSTLSSPSVSSNAQRRVSYQPSKVALLYGTAHGTTWHIPFWKDLTVGWYSKVGPLNIGRRVISAPWLASRSNIANFRNGASMIVFPAYIHRTSARSAKPSRTGSYLLGLQVCSIADQQLSNSKYGALTCLS